jgi:hypothetical protein
MVQEHRIRMMELLCNRIRRYQALKASLSGVHQHIRNAREQVRRPKPNACGKRLPFHGSIYALGNRSNQLCMPTSSGSEFFER